jgi:hypothetical protein
LLFDTRPAHPYQQDGGLHPPYVACGASAIPLFGQKIPLLEAKNSAVQRVAEFVRNRLKLLEIIAHHQAIFGGKQ